MLQTKATTAIVNVACVIAPVHITLSLPCGAQKRQNPRMNPQKTTILILATLFASLGLAEDFKTTSGKEYKEATVTHVEPDGIVVRSKSGISKIYFTELSSDVQQRFHYDPQSAAAAHANEMAAIQQTNQQTSEANQQKNLESQLSQLQQQEENLRVQIGQAKDAPRSRQPSQTGTASLAAQAHEESLTQRQKERQLKQRQKEYQGAKQAAARNGLNANMVAPPRYGDVTYHPYGTAQNAEQGSVSRADLPALESQLDAVRQQREQLQREMARKGQH